MKINQITEAVQAGLDALIGANLFPVNHTEDGKPEKVTLTYGDPTAFTDMGEIVENNPMAVDIVFNALADVLDKIIVEDRKYKVSVPSLLADPREFGGLMEIVRTGLSDVLDDPMWDANGFINYNDPASGGKISGKDYAAKIAAIEHGYYKPKVYAKLYKKANACMIALSTLRDQLFTAFHSWEQVGSFLNSLRTSVENTIALKAELQVLMTISAMIGRAKALGHEIPLVTMYNTLTGENIQTGEKALQDDKFCRYLMTEIMNTRDNMVRYSTAYNNGEMATFTPAQDNRLILLSKVANALKTGVRANTFHEELLGIGEYEKVSAWMGTADTTGNFRFETVSSIMLTQDAAAELGITPAENTTINNVIGVMYDDLMAKISIEKTAVYSNFTASTGHVNSFHHFLQSTFVNDSHSCVFFTLN